jgi:hypothetical protein
LDFIYVSICLRDYLAIFPVCTNSFHFICNFFSFLSFICNFLNVRVA